MQAKDLRVFKFGTGDRFGGVSHLRLNRPYNILVWDSRTDSTYNIRWSSHHRFPRNRTEIDVLGHRTGAEEIAWNGYLTLSIPQASKPHLWAFSDRYGLFFAWRCWRCWRCGWTSEKPVYAVLDGDHVDGWYCETCFARYSCPHCGELNDPNDPWWTFDEHKRLAYRDGRCPACGRDL